MLFIMSFSAILCNAIHYWNLYWTFTILFNFTIIFNILNYSSHACYFVTLFFIIFIADYWYFEVVEEWENFLIRKKERKNLQNTDNRLCHFSILCTFQMIKFHFSIFQWWKNSRMEVAATNNATNQMTISLRSWNRIFFFYRLASKLFICISTKMFII